MAPPPITLRLRCASWEQLESIYRRDLCRGVLFLRTSNRPELDTPITIHLTLPSGTLIILSGHVAELVPPGGLEGRGPGVSLTLEPIPASTLWLIESALKAHRGSAALANRPAGRSSGGEEPTAPSMDAGSEVAEAEDALVAALQEELRTLRGMSALQVLGLGAGASDQDVHDAFAALSKRYHPDKYARYDHPSVRELVAEIFLLIRDAYRTLRSRSENAATGPSSGAARSGPAESPRRADGRTQAPAARHTRAPASPPPEAGEAGDAERAPARPDRANPRAKHARAEALLDEKRYDEALALYGLAARRDRGDLEALVGIELAEGLKALANRDRLEAAQRFEAALELDPQNERAAGGLTEIRRLATEERKGFLARLLGDKE